VQALEISQNFIIKSGVSRVAFSEVGLYNQSMYYVYILKSSTTNQKYIGYSTNLKERLKQHNRKQSNYTSCRGPYKIIWYCAFEDKERATSFEKYLKSSSGFAFTNKHLLN